METPDESVSDRLLEELNKRAIQVYAPVIAYIAVVIFLGILGNIMTLIFYGFKTEKSTHTVSLSFLAAIDLTTNVILSDEIIDLCFSVTFKSVAGCRLRHFLNTWSILCSLFVLCVICIDRYRKICRCFAWQFTMGSIKVAFAVAIGIALVFAGPYSFIHDIIRVNVSDNHGNAFVGFTCSQSDHDELQGTISAFYVIALTVICGVITTVAVLYSLIGRSIIICRRKTITDATVHNRDHNRGSTDEELTVISPCGERQQNQYKCSKETLTIEIKLTLITFAITIGYILSFIPYFIVRLGSHTRESNGGYSVGLQLAVRSFVMTCAINPFIIFVFNPSFRLFIKRAFCMCSFVDSI